MSGYEILFADDEPRVLQSFARQLKKQFSIRTAGSGEEALAILEKDGPCPVMVSDMRMPGMDGIRLFAIVKDKYPDMLRIMLTGHADQQSAIDAVNRGQVFRFLTKPIAPDLLIVTLELALGRHRQALSEKALLNQTLKGSVQVMSELLGLANSIAFSSGCRIKDTVVKIARKLRLDGIWQFEIAALMSQIGCVTIPEDILRKMHAGEELTEKERKMYHNHPRIGARLVRRIPRLEHVAAMIEHQMLHWDAFDEEPESRLAAEERVGAQILKAAIDHDSLLARGVDHREAADRLRKRDGVYNPEVIELLAEETMQQNRVTLATLYFDDILPGMVADENVYASNGALVIPRGQEITWSVIQELTNYIDYIGIKDPIRVRIRETENTEPLHHL